MARWMSLAAFAVLAGLVAFLALRDEGRGRPRARVSEAPPREASPRDDADDGVARLAAALRDADHDRCVDAAVALRAHGARAVPVFVDLLATGDRDGRVLAARSLGKLGTLAAPAVGPLGDILREDDKALRLAAIEALGHTEAKDATAPLLPMLRHPDRELVLAALGALTAIGADSEDAARAVAAVLDPSRGNDVDRAALDALEAIGPAAVAVLADLLAAFENRTLLSPAIEVLEAIGPAAHAAVPALVEVIRAEARADEEELQRLLKSPSLAVPGSGPYPEYDAERALVAIGEGAVPGVLAMLADDLRWVRRSGGDILAKIGESVLAHLEPAAVDPDPRLRQAVARALAAYAKRRPELLGVLARLAADPDAGVRTRALESLGSYGPPAAPVLVAALAETERRTLEATLDALRHVRLRDRAAVPRLIELLDHDESMIRWGAADVLASMGEAAGAGIQALVRHLGDESEYMRKSAGEALEKLGDLALPALLAHLGDAPLEARRGVAALLAKREKPPDGAVAAASQLIASADLTVRTFAAATLARAGVDNDAVVSTLVAGLGAGPKGTREAAADGLRCLGAKAARALPEILRACARESDSRVFLGDTLAAVAVNEPAVLARALASESWNVRYDCASALRKIGAPGVPAVADVLARGPHHARIAACRILRVSAAQVPAAREALEGAARDPKVSDEAIDSLWSATRDATFLVPLLLHNLEADSPRRRADAAYRLSRIGARAAFAVRELRAAHAAATHTGVRKRLAQTIEAIENR